MSSARPWRSGWCGHGNPTVSHQRCVGVTETHDGDLLCSCACHLPPLSRRPQMADMAAVGAVLAGAA